MNTPPMMFNRIPRFERKASDKFITWSLALLIFGLETMQTIRGMDLTYTLDGSSNAVPDGVIFKLAGTNEAAVSAAPLTQGVPSGTTFALKGKLPSGTPSAPKLPILAGSVTFAIGSVNFVDDGSGWVGNVDPDHYCSGTIDYATGAFSLVYPGTKVPQVSVAVSATATVFDGTTAGFSGTLSGPVQPNTVHFRSDEYEAIDSPNADGKTGVFTRDGSVGTIDYITGSYSGTFPYAPRYGQKLTVEYCNNPPAASTPCTVSYHYAKGPGRLVPTNLVDTLEAEWFNGSGTSLTNCSNAVARVALQKAVGATERWAAAQNTDSTILILPSGTIHFGDRLNRVYIRKGHFILAGSGSQSTCIAPRISGSNSANRSIVIEDTASNVKLNNLKFDLQSAHSDFRNSVTSSADFLEVTNCEFGDSDAMTLGKATATVSGIVSNWTSGSSGYTAQVTYSSGVDLTWLQKGGDLQIYDSSGVPKCYASGTKTGASTCLIKADKLPPDLALNDRLEFYETFTRHALESDGSHVTISNCKFQNTQLRLSTGDEMTTEDVTVNNNQFLDSQAYSISCVGRSRSDKVDQIRKDIRIHDNEFSGFLRAAVYVGLDWGDAMHNGTVLENIEVKDNQFEITKAWRGEQVFRYHLGKSNRNFTWSGNTITFVDRPIAAESCLHLIAHAAGNLRLGLFERNTVTSEVSTDIPGFEHTMWLEATDEFLMTGNSFSTGGDVYLWKGASGVRIEDNTFENVRQVLRAENVGRFSLVGNSITPVNNFTTKMFSLSANSWSGEDITIANNLINLTGTTGSSDLTAITGSNGSLSNVNLLNNNVITGKRLIYSGTAAVTYSLPGVVNWNFDEGFGNKAGDGSLSSSGTVSTNDLLLVNSATWASDRAALSLDGVSAYATMPATNTVNLLSDFSICAWVHPVKTDGYRTIVSRVANSNQYQYALAIKDSHLSFEQKTDSSHTEQHEGGVLPVDEWHHVAVTSSSDHTITLYVDGSAVKTFSSTLTSSTSGTTFDVGRLGGTTPGSYYAGDIDDLQIYSAVLSSGNIQAVANERGYGYWRMNEGSGITIADESGLYNTGTRFGGSTWVTGVGGTALQFDGSTGYVDAGHPSSLNITLPFSITAWVCSTASDTKNHTIVSKNVDTASQMLDLSMKNGQWIFSFSGTTLIGASGAANRWQHVAATVDSFGNAYLYCNGEIIASGTGFGPVNTGAASLNIGKRVGSSGANYFQGAIDDVEIYNRALWPDEVRVQSHLP